MIFLSETKSLETLEAAVAIWRACTVYNTGSSLDKIISPLRPKLPSVRKDGRLALTNFPQTQTNFYNNLEVFFVLTFLLSLL